MSGTAAAAEIGRFASELELPSVPAELQQAGKRALANIVGVTLGGAGHDATQRAVETMDSLGGNDQARAIGIGWANSVDRVALVDGIAAHVLDYDDTQLESVYHPSAPVFAALAPLAEWREATGQEFLTAWIIGLEVGMRLAQALTREHYDRGWHVTGTAGVVAAAAASATLLGLEPEQFAYALGVAATQSSAHRIHFGTMTKSLHVGLAGASGLTSALLAEHGFDADPAGIEGRGGMLEVMAAAPEPELLTDGLGEIWHLIGNCLKPYACGVVTHPVIDATRELRDVQKVDPNTVEEITIQVEPLVTELTGKASPANELEAKFSAWHCAAVGLLHGQAGPGEFADEIVVAPETVAIRERINIEPSDMIHHMTAELKARLNSGEVIDVSIEHARGTPQRQLTDDELKTKFLGVSAPVLPGEPAAELFTRLMALEEESSWAKLVEQTIPRSTAA